MVSTIPLRSISWFCILLFSFSTALYGAEDVQDSVIAEGYENNESCLVCHGQKKYILYSSDSSEFAYRSMSAHGLIERDAFYHVDAVHRNFSCVDCHSEEYSVFPHAVDLRFEYMYECIDCHGGDDTYAQYHFEDIVTEYEASIHTEIEEGVFSCWSCHNAHSYVVHARNETDISDVVAYNNNVCLGCHTDVDRYSLLSKNEVTDLIGNHDWLPNQALHFKMVRCIDCHASAADSVMVAHHILGKEESIRNCEACHSANSHLSNTLYKFNSMQERNENGFLNAVVINDSYMIGANRNLLLNWASAILFLIVIGGIGFHSFKRILNTEKS